MKSEEGEKERDKQVDERRGISFVDSPASLAAFIR